MRLPFLLTAPRFDNAECAKESDQDFFFPESGLQWSQRLPHLRQICGRCVHQAECLEFAISNNEINGYWGNKTPDERKLISDKGEITKSNRLREIEYFKSQGMSIAQIAEMYRVKPESISRQLQRAKRKGVE